MRTEHGGTESLYQRLQARTAGSKTLTSAQVQSLVRQMSNAVHHLHSGPRICHHDIKPESWALTEGPTGEIRLKLVNFDIAVVQRPGGSCRLKSGTFPFVAPEVVAERYDGMASDMWSMGVLLLELACGTRIIERCIMETFSGDWRITEADGFPLKAVQHVRDSLTEDNALVSGILHRQAVAEVATLFPWYSVAVNSLLQVDIKSRWSSEQFIEATQAYPLSIEAETEAAEPEAALGLADATSNPEPSDSQHGPMHPSASVAEHKL